MKRPLITVLLAVYNTDFELVKRAINSVLKQDMNDFELIILDDGSDEDYCVDLKKYAAIFPSIITYIYHPNCGQAESINKGISMSNGQYITIIDGDDEFKHNHLTSCLEQMQYADLIASNSDIIVDNHNDYYIPDRMDQSKVIHVDDCILFATLFGKKEVFTRYKFNDMYAADANFYERVSQEFKVKKVDLRTYIYYRNMPNSICNKLKNSLLVN